MRTADVRRACLALVHHRVCAVAPAADPAPVALGWHLDGSRASLNAMAALCAGALADAAPPLCWRPSPVLRALLGEYRAVRDERRLGPHRAPSAPRAADALH